MNKPKGSQPGDKTVGNRPGDKNKERDMSWEAQFPLGAILILIDFAKKAEDFSDPYISRLAHKALKDWDEARN